MYAAASHSDFARHGLWQIWALIKIDADYETNTSKTTVDIKCKPRRLLKHIEDRNCAVACFISLWLCFESETLARISHAYIYNILFTAHYNTRQRQQCHALNITSKQCKWCRQHVWIINDVGYSVTQTPWGFLTIFLKRLGIFSPNCTHSLNIPIYAGLLIII